MLAQTPNHQQRAAIRRALEKLKFAEFRRAGNSRNRSKYLARVKVDLMFEKGQIAVSNDGGKTKQVLNAETLPEFRRGPSQARDASQEQEDDGA